MDYNKPGISYGVANFNSSMQEINADIDSTEMIDGLMQWVEQYTNVLHEISVAETLDDLKELKQNAASPDVRPDVVIWALRRIVRVIWLRIVCISAYAGNLEAQNNLRLRDLSTSFGNDYLPQPSIRAAGFAVAGPAGLLEAQRYYRHCAVLSRYEEFSDILTCVREQPAEIPVR